jgi:serine protease Do
MRAKRPLILLAASAVFAAGAGLGWQADEVTNRLARLDTAQAQEPTTSSRPAGLTPDLMSFADVAEKITPAVVTIRADKTIKAGENSPNFQMPQMPFGDDFFRFFGPPRGDQRQRGMGSGFIVDPKGTILTNNHVVSGADRIRVRLADGREVPGKVVGADPATDIAVIRVDAGTLPAVQLGDDRKLRVGEWVLAVGSPLGPEYEHSVTAGIISAKGRSNLRLVDYEDYLQTDAAINPGNSGGPLVNLRGEVVGMNSAIASRTGGYQGLSFAIPMTMAEEIMNELVAHGKVTRSWLGINIQELTPEMAEGLKLGDTQGIVISDVVKGSPADKAGLEDGDVILALSGQPAGSIESFRSRVARTKPGTTVKLEVQRDDRKRNFDIRLEEKPEDEVAMRSSNSDAPENKLGLELQNVTPTVASQYNLEDRTGVLVTSVDPGSPAEEAGLRPGDVVRSVNRKRVNSVSEVKSELGHLDTKDPVVLQVRRDERTFYVTLSRDS